MADQFLYPYLCAVVEVEGGRFQAVDVQKVLSNLELRPGSDSGEYANKPHLRIYGGKGLSAPDELIAQLNGVIPQGQGLSGIESSLSSQPGLRIIRRN